MKKQNLFKMFRCIDIADCFAVNRLVFGESIDNKAQQLEEIQEKIGAGINPEITQALKKYTNAKRSVEIMTDLLKKRQAELASNPDDYNTRAQVRQTKSLLENSKDDLESAEEELQGAINDHSGAIEFAKKAADKIQKAEDQLATVAGAQAPQASDGQPWFDRARGKKTEPTTSVAQSAPTDSPAAIPAKSPADGKPKVVAAAGTGPAAAPQAGQTAPPPEPSKAPEAAKENVDEKYKITMEYIKNERTGKSLTGDAELDKKVTSDNFKKLLKQWSVADDKLEDPATVVEAIKKRQGEVNVNRDGILGPKTFSKLPSDERNILTGGQEAKAEAPVAPAPPAAVPPEAAPTPAAVPEVTPPPAEAVPDLSIFDKLNKKENFYILTFSAAGIEGAATVNQEAADKASMKEGEIVYLEKGKVESGKHETVTIVDSKGKTHEIDSSNLKTIISPVESKIQREINQYKIARFRESSLGEKFTRLNSIKTEDIKKLNNGNLVHIVNNKGLNQTDVANLFNGTLQSVDKNRLTNAEENEIFSALVTAYETQKTSIQ